MFEKLFHRVKETRAARQEKKNTPAATLAEQRCDGLVLFQGQGPSCAGCPVSSVP